MARRLTRVLENREPPLIESRSIAPDIAEETAAVDRPIGRRKGEVSGAADVAQHAKAELASITGLDADHVSAVEQRPDGWHVIVDLVELRRIPAATDVLAAYEAVLGPTGVLLSYRRIRRYFRDQMMEDS